MNAFSASQWGFDGTAGSADMLFNYSSKNNDGVPQFSAFSQ
jgi:hypothetical protein